MRLAITGEGTTLKANKSLESKSHIVTQLEEKRPVGDLGIHCDKMSHPPPVCTKYLYKK